MGNFIPALGALLGAIVGAAGAYFVSRSTEERKKIAELSSDSYVGLFSNIAAGSMSPDHERFFSEKVRIAIFGDDQVVRMLAAFNKIKDTESDEQVRALVGLVVSMRSHKHRKTKVTEAEIRAIIIGK